MSKDAETTTPVALIAGRHVVGMAIVALANPLIYYGGGFYQWSVALGAALFGAAVVYGLYALVFTQRAKAAWPGSFFMLAWVLLLLALLQGWTDRPKEPRSIPVQAVSSPQPKSQTFTYEEAVGLPPAKN